jgi:hypothetical protein
MRIEAVYYLLGVVIGILIDAVFFGAILWVFFVLWHSFIGMQMTLSDTFGVSCYTAAVISVLYRIVKAAA